MSRDPSPGCVLITGAARRLGAAMARRLHAEGMRIALHFNSSRDRADALAEALNDERAGSVSVHQADLLDTADLAPLVRAAADAHGGLHALINNASSFYPTPLGEVTEAHWTDLMATNLKAPFFLSQAAAPWLRASRGCILNMVDVHAMRPLPDYPVYCAAKAGLVSLTESLALALAPQVRVNGIAPGPILPPSDAAEGESAEEPSHTPLQRWGDVDNITDAALYLIRDASYTTGAVLPVDGGRRITVAR